MGGSSKGGGGGSQVVGYRYRMGLHFGLCHGPVDELKQIVIGDRAAWSGSVTSNATITINSPELFGGDKKEGGVSGALDVLMGGAGQAVNAYLTSKAGSPMPAFRGILSAVFNGGLITSNNPYVKPWAFDIKRITQGWSTGAAWYSAKADISGNMNPAHILYQCLTDTSWGMGYPASAIDSASFTTAADALYTEGFGLSILWNQQNKIEEFIQDVLNHIAGVLGVRADTGTFALKLIRGDYDRNTLALYDGSNVISASDYQRQAWGETTNEIAVVYIDPATFKETSITVQDLANINTQGGVVAQTRKYMGIRSANIAKRVAMRDLLALSTPLARVKLTVNRKAWGVLPGDVFRLTWPDYGISDVVYRVLEVNKGTLQNGEIVIDAVEDIFGLPTNAYIAEQPGQWTEPTQSPQALANSIAIEATYWDVVRTVASADIAYLTAGYGFGMLMAARGPSYHQNLLLSQSADDVTFTDVGGGEFSPSGTLAQSINQITTSISISGASDLDKVVLAENGGYAYIGDECVSITSIDASTGAATIGRGVLDTTPKSHNAGDRIYFYVPGVATDPTERTSGETVYYRPRPRTGLGVLPVGSAASKTLVLGNRATRPYPPGNFKVDGQYYPANITGPEINITWSHRDRLAQTASLVPHTTGNIGPEAGTTYRVRVYDGATLKRTYDMAGTVTAWSYPTDHDVADGGIVAPRITVHSVRDGLESFKAAEHTFTRTFTNGHTVTTETPPATPILTATAQDFSILLSWLFGDSRTNIAHTEIIVADVPDMSKAQVLRYENYPGQEYLHEIGTVMAYKWYWARTTDSNGMVSAWSNMVSARALTATPEKMLSDINALLTSPSTPNTIQLLSDRFSIVAPDGTKTPFAVVETSPGVWSVLLNSNVQIGGNVDIANLKTGSLPNDVIMRLGGGVIELDGAGEIRVFKDLQANADFVRLSSGEIRFLMYKNGAYQTYNFLSRLEAGAANSGNVVSIPGYWKTQPRVMVSPSLVQMYSPTYSAQGQSIRCQASSLVETTPGSGQWQFTASATLELSANTGNTTVGATSGDQSSDTFTSVTYTTLANCESVTANMRIRSKRGNGLSQYYYRKYRTRIDHSTDGVSWTLGTFSSYQDIGAVLDTYVSWQQVKTFPSAGTWKFRVVIEWADKDGSVFGAISYNYSSETLQSLAVSTNDLTANSNSVNNTHQITLPASTLNPTWEIYQLSYTWEHAWTHSSAWSDGGGHPYGSSSYTFSNGDYYSYSSPAANSLAYTAKSLTITGSSLAYDQNKLSCAKTATIGSPYSCTARTQFRNSQCVVYRRTPQANSTIAVNTFAFDNYGYSLSAAQVLASGTLNWLAIGE